MADTAKATTTPVAPAVPQVFALSMQADHSIVVDPKSPSGINSPYGLILFDGVCILCSRGCRFVSKRDRRGYFRFVPIQLAEGRPLAEQLGIDPDRPDSFAFVATGQAYVKSEAALRIARELPRLQLIGLHAPKRAFDICEPWTDTYFNLMPIHEKLRGRDYPTIRNYLRVTLCNIHDEFTKRLDAASVAAALRGD
jgi:predicted DCC family thiol-disulfide oxidoreductase YuxK